LDTDLKIILSDKITENNFVWIIKIILFGPSKYVERLNMMTKAAESIVTLEQPV